MPCGKGTFSDENDAIAAMSLQVGHVRDAIAKDRTDWDEVFGRKKVVGPLVFLGQSVVQQPVVGSSRVPTPLKGLFLEMFGQPMNDDAKELLRSMNMFMATLVGSKMTVEE